MVMTITVRSGRLLAWSWVFRWVHIALDTIVLYGVLHERNLDERGDDAVSNPLSSEQTVSRRGAASRRSEGSNNTNKTSQLVTSVPVV